MPQPNPWATSGGAELLGMGTSELLQIRDVPIRLLPIRLLLFPGVADLLRSRSTLAQLQMQLEAHSFFGVVQGFCFFFLCSFAV